MKHTKGPWTIDGGTNKKGDLFLWKAGNYYGGHAIATIHGEVQEGAEANARLIATAPELLAALKQAISMLDSDISWLPEDYPARSIVARAEAVIKFHKAIAKAEET